MKMAADGATHCREATISYLWLLPDRLVFLRSPTCFNIKSALYGEREKE